MSKEDAVRGVGDGAFFRLFAETAYAWESWQGLDGEYLYITPFFSSMIGR